MKHPLRRCTSSSSPAFGLRGTQPVARQSRFHGRLERNPLAHAMANQACFQGEPT